MALVNALTETLPRLAECVALLAIGYNLRASGLFRESDGQTAARLASYITQPALILQVLCSGTPLSSTAWVSVAAGAIIFATQVASSWIYCLNKSKRERAVSTGSTSGLSLALLGYPFVEAVFGAEGLQPLVLLDLVNIPAVLLGSYLLFASSGAAFPESFPHEDGGKYRGQWRGMRKEGHGVYVYPSGAKYEGEWRDNLKDGRGVYHYPSGGTYEGEWSRGVMSGVGVRTLSSGQVKAGRWRGGQLEEAMELWQCANAAEGAAEAALAARGVEVGGDKPLDALQHLLLHPPLWAILGGLGWALTGRRLPPSLALLTAALAPANKPLALLAAGMVLRGDALPQRRMVPDVAWLLASRYCLPLAIGASLVASVAGLGRARPGLLLPLLVTIMAFMAPVPPQAVPYSRRFRLNEALAAALVTASHAVSLPLLCLLGLAATAVHAQGLLPAMLAPTTTTLPGAAAAVAAAVAGNTAATAATAGAVVPAALKLEVAASAAAARYRWALWLFVGGCWVVAGGLQALAARLAHTMGASDKRVLMVYTGVPQSSTGPAAAATASGEAAKGAAGHATAPSSSKLGSSTSNSTGSSTGRQPGPAVQDTNNSSSSNSGEPGAPPSSSSGSGSSSGAGRGGLIPPSAMQRRTAQPGGRYAGMGVGSACSSGPSRDQHQAGMLPRPLLSSHAGRSLLVGRLLSGRAAVAATAVVAASASYGSGAQGAERLRAAAVAVPPQPSVLGCSVGSSDSIRSIGCVRGVIRPWQRQRSRMHASGAVRRAAVLPGAGSLALPKSGVV